MRYTTEWVQFQMTIPNIGEDEQQKLSCQWDNKLTLKLWNTYWQFIFKAKHTFTLMHSVSLLRYIPRKKWIHMFTKRHVQEYSLQHYSWNSKLEMSTKRKIKTVAKCNEMNEFHKYNVEQKDTKEYIHSIYFLKV